MTFSDKLTFSDKVQLVNAIEDVATWTRNITNEKNRGSEDYDDIEKMEKWLEDAKNTIFDIATKQSKQGVDDPHALP